MSSHGHGSPGPIHTAGSSILFLQVLLLQPLLWTPMLLLQHLVCTSPLLLQLLWLSPTHD
jgi:hypothetical protein